MGRFAGHSGTSGTTPGWTALPSCPRRAALLAHVRHTIRTRTYRILAGNAPLAFRTDGICVSTTCTDFLLLLLLLIIIIVIIVVGFVVLLVLCLIVLATMATE